ncbi:hypothetical protein QTI66_02950 [Variovorax sp. J22R133]|nr:hypothetical protein [Variovorax sp. J22R133]MDM0111087.1 hypothetical protein [Variovorax sp. J22R133]
MNIPSGLGERQFTGVARNAPKRHRHKVMGEQVVRLAPQWRLLIFD